MNATELYLKDGRAAGIFFCGECRIVHRDESLANQCCSPRFCTRCGVAEQPKYSLLCEPCARLASAERERERFEKAEKVEEWDGWVYCEGTGRDGYSESIEELLDLLEDSGDPIPPYVWTCTAIPFAAVTIDEIKDRICDDAYEDFDADDLSGLDDLKEALDKFNQANEGVLSYQPDYTKAVLICVGTLAGPDATRPARECGPG